MVDLPGIILVPNEEQTEDDVDTVHRRVDQYLKSEDNYLGGCASQQRHRSEHHQKIAQI